MEGQKGFTLIETIVAIGLLGIIGVVFLSTLTTSLKAVIIADLRETAKNVAEMQMEYARSSPWSWTGYLEHPEIATRYPGFTTDTATAALAFRDTNIQKIIVTVRNGSDVIFSVVGYKEKPKG